MSHRQAASHDAEDEPGRDQRTSDPQSKSLVAPASQHKQRQPAKRVEHLAEAEQSPLKTVPVLHLLSRVALPASMPSPRVLRYRIAWVKRSENSRRSQLLEVVQ